MTALPGRRRRTLPFLLLVFLAALLFRVGYQAQMRDSPLWDHLILDEAYNDAWAVRAAAGDGPPTLPYFRAPLYPGSLALTYRLFGHRPALVRLWQALLSSLSCLLIVFLAHRLFGRFAAGAAGLLAAFYWPWAYFDGELQDVPLTLFLNLAALALLVSTENPGPLQAGPAGVLLGLSAVTRPTVLVVVPAVLLWLLWQAVPRRPARQGLVVAALLTGMALPILPVTMRNVLQGGDHVLIASQGGINFFLGNNPESDGHSARLPGSSGEWEELLEESRRRAEAAAGRPLRPSEISRHWFGRGVSFWMQEPVAALALTARKVGYLLGAPELANNKQVVFFSTTYAPLMRLPWPGFGLVAPLALIGLLWGGGGAGVRLLQGFAFLYGAAVVAFFVAARLRMPVAVTLIVFAGAGAAVLLDRWRGADRRRLVLPAVVLAASLVGVNLPRLWHTENLAHAHYSLGNAQRAAGDGAAAVDEYRQALHENPSFRPARRDLAAELLRDGRAAEVLDLLQPALRGDPGDSASRVNLAMALRSLGRREEAIDQLQSALSASPEHAAAWLRLGNLQVEAGRDEEAAQAFARAMDLDAADAAARYNLANLLLARGETGAAVAHYHAIVAQHPDHRGSWNNLGIAQAGAGEMEAAEASFRGGLRQYPGDPQLLLNLAGTLRAQGKDEEARRALQRALQRAPAGSDLERQVRERLQMP